MGIQIQLFKDGAVRPHDYNNPRVPVTNEFQITVNGEQRRISSHTTLMDLVRDLDLDPERVAVEMNRTIIKRELWSTTEPGDRAEIEIVQFVGGG